MNYIIVTNTYHRPVSLVERSLNASLSQAIAPLKVILIDQNETKLSLSEEILNNPVFERQVTGYNSVSAARNSLIIPPGTEWIFFCDDDGYPDKDYSIKLNDIILNSDYEILAGSIIREDTGDFYSLRHKKGGSLSLFRNTKNLMGSNFVIKVSTFEELNRFDHYFGVGAYWQSSEETDFCWKAFFANKKMEYFPSLKVYHVPPFNESVKLGFKKAFKYGVGKGALVGKWLFAKRKVQVVYELGEMMILPFVLSVRGLLVLKPQLFLANIAALSGRIYGLIKFLFVRKYTP